MKKILLLILVLFAFKGYSQNMNYLPYMWLESDTTVESFSMINFYAGQMPDEKKHIAKNNIHVWKTRTSHFDKKGNTKLRGITIYTFDKRGNVIAKQRLDKKNVAYSNSVYQYNDSNKVLKYIEKNKKGITKVKDSATYNNDGKQTGEYFFRRGGALLQSKILTSYNNRGQITEINDFKYNKKGTEKPWGRYVTIYDADGSKGETKWYNGKGKLKHDWSFKCNPEGTVQKPSHVDSTNVCVKYDYINDGSKIKTLIYTDRKKRITKNVLKYDPAGNLTEYTFYNSKNKITVKYIYTFNADKIITSWIQYQKGGEKIKLKTTMEYNASKQCTKYTKFRHDKLKNTYVFDFNEKGLRTGTTTFNHSGKKTMRVENNYEFF